MNFLSKTLNSIPVVGHVKGALHHAVGDTEGGNAAMHQASKTTAVVVGGAAGCIVGPVTGALAGAKAANASMKKTKGPNEEQEN